MIDAPRPEEKEKLVALAEGTGFFTSEEIAVVRELLDEFFNPKPTNDYHFVVYRAATGTAPLGLACYGAAPMTEGTYDLYWIMVDKAHQNKKIGRTLIEFVESELKRLNARILYAETSDNVLYDPTRAFYERQGYTRVAHLPDFYKPGDGKVIYGKRLNK